ncbi:GNAT family N-acetyltransferase [Ulvibacterium sp.]|uniref:GNAT family N-acetyltransferase n=1 Tax=Ulvibacterium sp. TaxID=2665914 RepID=UPI003BA86DE7
MNIDYRLIKQDEYQFLKEMLYEALFVPPGKPKFPKSILESPDLIKYVENWNQQEGDLAIVGVKDHKLIGAIWGRKFEKSKKGYGFVDENTPEISMAVKPKYRNSGIGTTLINQIENEFLRRGVNKLSLSVDKLNPAKKLYERCGFEFYEEEETAITMIKVLKKAS